MKSLERECNPIACEGILQFELAQVCSLVHALIAKPIDKMCYQQSSASDRIDMVGSFAWLSDGRF